MKKFKGKQIADNTITQSNMNITTASIVSLTSVTNKEYVDSGVTILTSIASGLTSSLISETSARTYNDSLLNASISAETSARTYADSGLTASISGLTTLIDNKADKPVSITPNNIYTVDNSGNLVDSGVVVPTSSGIDINLAIALSVAL